MERHFLRILCLGLFLLTSSCAYRFSNLDRELPGGYRVVSVPIFKNLTYEPGIEADFTNAFILELTRNRKISVTSSTESPIKIEGIVETVSYVPIYPQTSSEIPTLPEGTALNSEYRILVTVFVKMVRTSDRKQIWAGRFQGERRYSAPRVGSSGLNSVNPLYNQSSRRITIAEIARDMMLEAHNQLTENF